MDIVQGKVLEVSHDYENVFHIVIEAQLPDGVAQVRLNASLLGQDPRVNPASRMPNEPFRFITTTTGEPAFESRRLYPNRDLLPGRGHTRSEKTYTRRPDGCFCVAQMGEAGTFRGDDQASCASHARSTALCRS
jgi:hypothetical protein